MVFGHILEKMVSLLAANVIEISLWYGKLRLRLLLLLWLFGSGCSGAWLAGWLRIHGAASVNRMLSAEYYIQMKLTRCALNLVSAFSLCAASWQCM